MADSCLFLAQDDAGNKTHEAAENENSHTESSIWNVVPPEELGVDFIDESSK